MSLSRQEYIQALEGLAVLMAIFWLVAIPTGIIVYLVMQ